MVGVGVGDGFTQSIAMFYSLHVLFHLNLSKTCEVNTFCLCCIYEKGSQKHLDQNHIANEWHCQDLNAVSESSEWKAYLFFSFYHPIS